MNAFNQGADFTSHHIEGYAAQGGAHFDVPLISHIEGNLWQGGCINGVSLSGRFKHVISLYPWERYNPGCELDTFVEARLYDAAAITHPEQLYSLANLVNVCQTLGPTLVHCQAGLNRSALIAGLAQVLNGRKPADAIALMRARRCGGVLCNKVFENWLLHDAVK